MTGKNFWQTLPRPFFALAPMDGATDVVFRHIIAKAARPDIFFTEFTNAASYFSEHGRTNAMRRLRFTPDEQPLVAQIWGTDPEQYAFMAKGLKDLGFAGIDINMGCPVKDVVKRGACSALIQTPGLAAELIAAAKEGGLPVSVKTRLGFKTQITEEWLGFLLNQDLAALTVHARTAKEMSLVPARWEEIAKVVALRDELAPHTAIIGNGDVANRQAGLARATQTSVDGVMIGRGAFVDPFCFSAHPREHSKEERLGLLRDHLDLFEETWRDTKTNFVALRRFFKIYVRDFDGASELRVSLMEAASISEVRAILKRA